MLNLPAHDNVLAAFGRVPETGPTRSQTKTSQRTNNIPVPGNLSRSKSISDFFVKVETAPDIHLSKSESNLPDVLTRNSKTSEMKFGLKKENPDIPLSAQYPKNMTSDKDKHIYEANTAKRILENRPNRALIIIITDFLMPLIQSMSNKTFDEYKTDVYNDINLGNFPIPSHEFSDYSSKQSLYKTLKTLTSDNKNNIVYIISIIWRLMGYLLKDKDPTSHDRFREVYENFIPIGRNHQVHEDWNHPITEANKNSFQLKPKGSLGEAEIESNLLTELYPLKKLSAYYNRQSTSSQDSLPALCRKNSALGMPYLSGISGMCNNFCAIYQLVDINFDSIIGIHLAEIMSAFNVAIGFHTFKECKDAFDITQEYMKDPNKLMDDYRTESGFFTPLHESERVK